MKTGVLTSSRADYGIYLPLLKALKKDNYFDLEIIAFGTHLSKDFGYTIKNILNDGFEVNYRMETVPASDSEYDIASSMASTMHKFALFWNKHQDNFDIVFCLGDRYEMFSAVSAGVPFNIPFAHIHGGETTAGAIDDYFRHSISLASKLHFVSTESYARRVESITGSNNNIFNVGALSLDNLDDIELYSVEEFKAEFNIDLSKPTILTTFHPETRNPGKNEYFALEICSALSLMNNYQVLITLPNVDTKNNAIRQAFIELSERSGGRVITVENLGTRAYFTAMKYASFMLGNTSSGIIEAASFNKYVINLGDRQLGREVGINVKTIAIKSKSIIEEAKRVASLPKKEMNNIYYSKRAAMGIINALKIL